jgi:hypothetical protein
MRRQHPNGLRVERDQSAGYRSISSISTLMLRACASALY